MSPFRWIPRKSTPTAPSTRDGATRGNVFKRFDFSDHTIETARAALPRGLSERECVALALLALDQAGVDVTTQEHLLETLARDGHA